MLVKVWGERWEKEGREGGEEEEDLSSVFFELGGTQSRRPRISTFSVEFRRRVNQYRQGRRKWNKICSRNSG